MYKIRVKKGMTLGFIDKKDAMFDDETSALKAAIQHGGSVQIVRVVDNRVRAELIITCMDCGSMRSECHKCEKPIFCMCHRGVRLCDTCDEIVRNLPPEPDPDEEFWK